MKKLYESMEHGENLEWCKPISCKDGKVIFAQNEGRIVSIQIDGEDVDATPENITRAARIVSANYHDESEDYNDAEIIVNNGTEIGCAACPWRDVCEAMECEE